MQCQQATEILSDYTARALDPALTVSVDNHLAECTACREQAGALRRVWAQLDQMPVAEPPAGLHASILSALDDQFAQAERDAVQRRRERFQFQWDWRALFQPRSLAYTATLLVVVLGSLEVVHSQRAAIDPLGSLLHVLSPPPPASAPLPSVRATGSRWTTGPEGGTLTIHLKAAPTDDMALPSLNYRAELVPNNKTNEGSNTPVAPAIQGHFDTAGTAVITIPLAQEQQLRDANLVLQVTLSKTENASEMQKVIIPLTLSHDLEEGTGR